MIASDRTVLLVDKDEDYLADEKFELERAGFKVVTADGQGKAEAVLETVRPDVVISEIMLEYKDSGFSLSHHIKKKDPRIAVILVSSVTTETGLEFDAATAEERSWVKADAMFAKPVRGEQLLWEIEQLVGD
jgi:two-component system response regulator VicR